MSVIARTIKRISTSENSVKNVHFFRNFSRKVAVDLERNITFNYSVTTLELSWFSGLLTPG